MNEASANSNLNANLPGPETASRNGPQSLRDRVKSLRLADRPPPRRTPLGVLPWALCLLFLGMTVVMAMRSKPPAVDAEETDKLQRDQSEDRAGPAGLAAGVVMLESKGYIVPIHQIQVSPKVSGMILDLRIEEGMVVHKDDVLAILEKVDYQSDFDSASAQRDAAKSRYEEVRLSLEHQKKQAAHDLEDAQAQYKIESVQYKIELDSKQGTPQIDLLRRQATMEAKQARVNWQKNQWDMVQKGSLDAKAAALKADYEQVEAALVKSKWRLDNCVVKAPVTGVILKKQAEEGSLVNPSAFSNGLSASLCDMADLAELEVDLAIPERDVARLIEFRLKHDKPQRCQVRADAFPDRVFDGYVSRIMPTADQSKAAVPVRVKVVVPEGQAGVYLRPQMNAAVTFVNAEFDPGLTGPTSKALLMSASTAGLMGSAHGPGALLAGSALYPGRAPLEQKLSAGAGMPKSK